jgi:hypothetical protein
MIEPVKSEKLYPSSLCCRFCIDGRRNGGALGRLLIILSLATCYQSDCPFIVLRSCIKVFLQSELLHHKQQTPGLGYSRTKQKAQQILTGNIFYFLGIGTCTVVNSSVRYKRVNMDTSFLFVGLHTNKARNPSGAAQFARNGVQRCHVILNCSILPNFLTFRRTGDGNAFFVDVNTDIECFFMNLSSLNCKVGQTLVMPIQSLIIFINISKSQYSQNLGDNYRVI